MLRATFARVERISVILGAFLVADSMGNRRGGLLSDIAVLVKELRQITRSIPPFVLSDSQVPQKLMVYRGDNPCRAKSPRAKSGDYGIDPEK